jgi:hypothetical protein
MEGGKRTLGELKAYLRATDHTFSNIISRDTLSVPVRLLRKINEDNKNGSTPLNLGL